MTARAPLVLGASGLQQQLQPGDTLSGVSTTSIGGYSVPALVIAFNGGKAATVGTTQIIGGTAASNNA